MSKLSGLGRGLGSLIPLRESSVTVGVSQTVPTASVAANPRQPRRYFSPTEMEDLLSSIKEHGIIQPLIIQEIGRGRYELIAGERRLRAAKMLGLSEVPVVIRSANEQEKLELALIENVQRQDLNAIEEAEAFRALVNEFGLSHEEVARRVGKSRSVVANAVRLLNLSPEIQTALIEGKISKSHARTLLAELDLTRREHLFHEILKGGVTVREVEARTAPDHRSAKARGKHPDILAQEKKLREILGTKVEIYHRGDRGKIIISYYSEEELRELLLRLSEF